MTAVFNTAYGKVGVSTAPITDVDASRLVDSKIDLSKSGLDKDFQGTWGLASKAFVAAAMKNHAESQESHIELRARISELEATVEQLKRDLTALQQKS